MEEWEKSLQAFNQSLELDPYYTYAYKGRGSLYTALNRFDEAEHRERTIKFSLTGTK